MYTEAEIPNRLLASRIQQQLKELEIIKYSLFHICKAWSIFEHKSV